MANAQQKICIHPIDNIAQMPSTTSAEFLKENSGVTSVEKRTLFNSSEPRVNESSQETLAQLTRSYTRMELYISELRSELEQVEKEKTAQVKARHASDNRMQALLNFLPGGVIVIDAKGTIIEANPAAYALLDTPLQGKIWRNVVIESFAPKGDDGFEVSTKSGKRISISTSSFDDQGQIILLTDQTETRRLQKNLSQYEKLSAMGKMVSALAHQIRTPLSAAMLYAGHLKKEELSALKRQSYTEKVCGRLHHMEKQIRDMMLFVKSELPLNECIDAQNLVIGLKDASEALVEETGLEISWSNHCQELNIKCNREALVSALMNLINNGMQASLTSIPPKISVELEQADNWLELNITDFGQGMNADQLEKAKTLFYTTKSQGTGLGIAVVQSVVKAHGGRFELTSKEGQGTCATIFLPLLAVNK